MMGAVWYRARAELRARWRALVLLGVLGGILAAAAMASAAGARRTASAYPRFLDRYQSFDVTVSFGGHEEADRYLREVARHPMVETSSRASFYFATIETGDRQISFPDVVLVGLSDNNGWDQMKVLEGRLPDPSSPDEVIVGYAFAERYDLRAGDRLGMEFRPWPGSPEVEHHDVTITGSIVMPGAFETITGKGFPSIIGGTPAFDRRFDRYSFTTDDILTVRLRGREDAIPAFGADLARRGIPTDGPPQPLSEFTSGVLALNQIPVVALWSASGLLALAAIAIVGQALARETAENARDRVALQALGLSANELAGLVLLRAALVAIVASLVGAVGAVALSPLTPVGIARIAEPDPGVAIDLVALGAGVGATLFGLVVVSIWPAVRSARARTSPARAGRSIAADSLARAQTPAPVVSGVRLAFAPGRSGVPARQAMVGGGLAIAIVVAALVFVSSFDRVLAVPRLTGHTWDASILTEAPLDEVAARIPAGLADEVWRGSVFPLAEVDGLTITAHASTGPTPSILRGRAPTRADEVALDPVTLERLDKGIGDRVRARDGIEGGEARDSEATHDLTIVGSFIVPRIVFQPAENAGQGVLFSPEGFERVTRAEFEGVMVRFASGVDPDDAIRRVREAMADLAFAVLSPLQRGMVRNMERISAVPLFLGGVFALIGAAALAHALALTIRRRRRDVAILKTIGFVSRQVRGTIRWQAMTFAVVALAVGLPAGILTGRWGWLAFANEIVVVPEPVVDLTVFLVIPAALALVLAISAFPARAAARTKAADVFRTE